MYAGARDNGHPVGEFRLEIGYTVEGDEPTHDLDIGLLPVAVWRNLNAD